MPDVFKLLLCFLVIAFLVACGSDEPGNDERIYTIELEKFNIELNADRNNDTKAEAVTKGINNALLYAKNMGYAKVKFPQGEYIVKSDWKQLETKPIEQSLLGIRVPSDMALDLHGATFRLLPNSYPQYSLFVFYEVENITVSGGHLIGDKSEHVFKLSPLFPANTHEWGFGFHIVNSANITIRKSKVEQMTGDAIILDGRGIGKNNKNILVTDNELWDCRRQGISVIGVIDAELSYNKIYKIEGTPPQCGIDMEVEKGHTGENIKVHNNDISQTKGATILCHTGDYIDVYENTVRNKIISVINSKFVKIHNNTLINTYIKTTHPANVEVYDNKTVSE